MRSNHVRLDPGITHRLQDRGSRGRSIFASQQDLQAAINDLLTSGFARCELSLRGAETDATAGRAPEALADDPATPRTDHFCTEVLGDAEGSLIGGSAVLPALGVAWAGAAAGAGVPGGRRPDRRERRRRRRGRGPHSPPCWPGTTPPT